MQGPIGSHSLTNRVALRGRREEGANGIGRPQYMQNASEVNAKQNFSILHYFTQPIGIMAVLLNSCKL